MYLLYYNFLTYFCLKILATNLRFDSSVTNQNNLKMALWAHTWSIKCQQGSLGRSGSSSNSRVSRWTWGSSLTLQVPGDTWAVIPAEFERPLVPTWLFTHTPPHSCHRDSRQAKEYAVIPLIHSIWWHHVTALLYGTASEQITVKLCPTPAFNQIQ